MTQLEQKRRDSINSFSSTIKEKTKPGNKNQKPFEKMMIMEYEVEFVGKIKMSVGIRRRTQDKVQHCITAITSI